jgi:hypothetical protein
MDLFSTHTHQPGVEERPRRTFMNILLRIRDSGMALLAMVLAVTFAILVAG